MDIREEIKDMRKWRCISVNNSNKGAFTIGKIYESDDEGYNFILDSGHKMDNLSLIDEMKCYGGKLQFEEIKEEQIDRDDMIEKLDYFCMNHSCDKCIFGDTNCDFEDLSDEDLTKSYNLAFGVKEDKVEEEEEKMKFKVGDLVKGNKLSDKYGFTDSRVLKAKVISINKDGEIEIEILEYDGSDREIGAKYDELDVECFDLVSDLSSKTITITTSDSTTTLTDGTHTTTINRYYTDKHDEKVAVNEVVKKYYDELDEIDRVSKEKHLIAFKNDYGIIGTPTILTDSIGRKLSIGDVVKIYDDDGNNVATEFVCNCEPYGDFIMGCGYATMNNSKKEFNYLKEFSYEEAVEKSLSFSELVVK